MTSHCGYTPDLGIHQLFEAQVERTPDAIALVFEDQQLTYRELNAAPIDLLIACGNQAWDRKFRLEFASSDRWKW